MAQDLRQQVIKLILEASELARQMGVQNLLQPGLVKEMIIADILGHQLITTKRDADACDPNNSSIQYEYLSCKEGGTGQLDRMFKEPFDKRQESLRRITRNAKVYLAIFYQSNQIKVKTIYELEPQTVLQEAERQLDSSRNAISHVGFSEAWAKNNGKIVYPKLV